MLLEWNLNKNRKYCIVEDPFEVDGEGHVVDGNVR